MSVRRFGPRSARIALMVMAILPVAACRRSETPPSKDSLSVSGNHRISQKEARVISEAAARVLLQVGNARYDMERGQLAAARHELEEADRLLSMITATMPTTDVRDRIQVAREHLEYESTQIILSDLVPVYEQLDFLGGYTPTQAALRHLDRAKRHLNSGERGQASEELDAAGAAAVYAELDLPLNETKAEVNRALAELVGGRVERADRALADAESSVRVLSSVFQYAMAGPR